MLAEIKAAKKSYGKFEQAKKRKQQEMRNYNKQMGNYWMAAISGPKRHPLSNQHHFSTHPQTNNTNSTNTNNTHTNTNNTTTAATTTQRLSNNSNTSNNIKSNCIKSSCPNPSAAAPRNSMSVSMSLVQGGAAGGAPQGASAILAAAAPYYQPPAVPQDVQPDRPIGYGAFGVVW